MYQVNFFIHCTCKYLDLIFVICKNIYKFCPLRELWKKCFTHSAFSRGFWKRVLVSRTETGYQHWDWRILIACYSSRFQSFSCYWWNMNLISILLLTIIAEWKCSWYGCTWCFVGEHEVLDYYDVIFTRMRYWCCILQDTVFI